MPMGHWSVGEWINTEYHVHENASQVELDLETHVDIGTIDGRTPPEREATIRDLVETRSLRIRELLVSHGFLETGRFLPEET